MRARFIGDPRNGGDGPSGLSLYGVGFLKGEWTGVPQALAGKLAGNNHFDLDANGDGQAEPTVEDLRARLDGLGVRYHHKAGLAKLTQLLADAVQPEIEG